MSSDNKRSTFMSEKRGVLGGGTGDLMWVKMVQPKTSDQYLTSGRR